MKNVECQMSNELVDPRAECRDPPTTRGGTDMAHPLPRGGTDGIRKEREAAVLDEAIDQTSQCILACDLYVTTRRDH